MAKTIIPAGLKGKDLYKFLVQNKSAIIAEKKSMPVKYSEPCIGSPSIQSKGGFAAKAGGTGQEDTGVIRVKMVGNACYWFDSHQDVAIPGCYDKTIKERGIKIVHLHDHIHRIEAKVGDVVSVYAQDIPLTDLGLSKSGSTQCFIMESDVRNDYNEKVYQGYKSGKIDQHSIALQYVQLVLCINDADWKDEFANWNKYYDNIINKEDVDQYGYFWAMIEIKIFENSGVLFGANELTPTLDADKSDTVDQPEQPTEQQPTTKGFNLNEVMKSLKTT